MHTPLQCQTWHWRWWIINTKTVCPDSTCRYTSIFTPSESASLDLLWQFRFVILCCLTRLQVDSDCCFSNYTSPDAFRLDYSEQIRVDKRLQVCLSVQGFLVGNAWSDPVIDNTGTVDFWCVSQRLPHSLIGLLTPRCALWNRQ